jgi:hypothetical protein
MGPLISLLIQIAILALVLAVALAAGWALARFGRSSALAVGAVTTATLAAGLWLLVRDAFEKVETDEVGVATVITSVLGVVWLAGMSTGYAVSRRRRA